MPRAGRWSTIVPPAREAAALHLRVRRSRAEADEQLAGDVADGRRAEAGDRPLLQRDRPRAMAVTPVVLAALLFVVVAILALVVVVAALRSTMPLEGVMVASPSARWPHSPPECLPGPSVCRSPSLRDSRPTPSADGSDDRVRTPAIPISAHRRPTGCIDAAASVVSNAFRLTDPRSGDRTPSSQGAVGSVVSKLE